eukprot:1145343_1
MLLLPVLFIYIIHCVHVQGHLPENAFDRMNAPWKSQHIHGQEVFYRERASDGVKIYQGDILLPDSIFDENRGPPNNHPGNQPPNNTAARAHRRLNPITDSDSWLWSYGYVPYVDKTTGQMPSRIAGAIADYEQQTVVRFRPRDGEAYWIEFVDDNDICGSLVGKWYGGQPVFLKGSCSKVSVIHEMMHVLGAYHTHSREDRDTYVTFSDNYKSNHNFNKEVAGCTDCGPYDYTSVMHGWSGSYGVTITPIKNSGGIGHYYTKGNAPTCDPSECNDGDGLIEKVTSNCWTGKKKKCVRLGNTWGLTASDRACINKRYLKHVRGTEKSSYYEMNYGEYLESGGFRLMNTGSIVLIHVQSGVTIWSIPGVPGDHMNPQIKMWNGGNLMLIVNGDVELWSSGSSQGSGNKPYKLGISSNGFVYILNKYDELIWSAPNDYSSKITPMPPTDKHSPQIPSLSVYNTLICAVFMIVSAFVTWWCLIVLCQKKRDYEPVKFDDVDTEP